jgi:hypothetical protein
VPASAADVGRTTPTVITRDAAKARNGRETVGATSTVLTINTNKSVK